MTKTKTKFRLRVLVVVEMTIIMVAVLLNLYLEWYVPQNTLDFELCGLESVECPNEARWFDFQDKMAEIAEYKQSRAYVIEVISEVARQERVDKDMMIAVHNCETAHTTNLYNENDPWGGANGYYQIIYKWHPEVTPECAYDPWCSARYFAKRVEQGDGHLWTCYRLVMSGEYKD